jgi:hypothetical protein
MGRYYSGEISGKFWFGIQDSNDADYFGVEYKDVIIYYVCNCYYDNDETYCSSCYSSLEEHMQAIKEEEEITDKTWHISDNEIYYEFTEDHVNNVKEQIKVLEYIVGKHMNSYKIIDDENEITYDYTIPDEINKDELGLIARLCLGKQILYCLEKNKNCLFYAEL